MDKLPFKLHIKRTDTNETETVTCIFLLRKISGKRKVYMAQWNYKDVIVKIFSDNFRAKYHMQREWERQNRLRDLKINTPEPLFIGQTENGHWAAVSQRITNSSTAFEIYRSSSDISKKLNLLVGICKELAKAHRKGVIQKDLHLGNFLLSGENIFVIDVGQMHFSSCEITRKKSISQLALLVSCLPENNSESIELLWKEYADTRCWQADKSELSLLKKKMATHRKKVLNKSLKKCLRTSKRYLRIRNNNYTAVFNREFCRDSGPTEFISRVDLLMDKGRILKKGNTCYVSHIRWNNKDKDIVVKRYNHKSWIHSLRHTIKKSRAQRCWVNGCRLAMLNILTPKPLAYIEKYKGPLVWESYIITEYIEGRKLHDFLRQQSISKDEHMKVKQQLKELLDKLKKHRITHGDLKHSNILITKDGPVLTDLDAMKVHKFDLWFNITHRKDLEHLIS